ncbi:hypothetical protein N657DRAFT_697880 [Parathielavia appendiculata]|uniref:Uncharacterized protein n=1 Tax=Parathielavia appendiculata TaxID=2587402 RepID=A0AAN6Z8K0_9PEZI|nr:hypothetical protein N657DRAFT_697880 [Parathielavia appendiculata]
MPLHSVTGWAREGLGKNSANTRDSVDFYLVRYQRTSQGCGGIRRQISCIVFHSFSSSLSIRDKLVESSPASCNILLGPLQFFPPPSATRCRLLWATEADVRSPDQGLDIRLY